MKTNVQLIEKVIKEVRHNLEIGDVAALELLAYLPTEFLISYLNEKDWGEYMNDSED